MGSTMSGTLSDAYGGGIRTVQRGQTSANLTNTALDVAITAVNSLTKTYVTANSGMGLSGSSAPTQAHGYLTSTTNLRIVNTKGDGSGTAPILAWEVVEFY